MELTRRRISAIVVERSAYDDVRIGEHLAPAGILQLKALDPGLPRPEDLHSRSAGVTAYWGSEMPNHMDYFLYPGQHGLNLCRPRFDADLARAAKSFGVSSCVRHPEARSAGQHVLAGRDRSCRQGRSDHGPRHRRCDGTLGHIFPSPGGEACAHDRQIALVAIHNDATRGQLGTRSIVEATETGWWYAAPINRAEASACS